MGFRFRKSLSLIPGVRVNLSKGLPSLSIGKKGFTVNLSKNGTRTTAGLPGSGMSYSTYKPHSKTASSPMGIWLLLLVIGVAALYIMATN
jgi:hypothetical protein